MLVGTASVEARELLSRMLQAARRFPSRCSTRSITSRRPRSSRRAGQRGAVTIATNMAGRGTDIKLGPGVPELGGLIVIGTERHEARRIDRQLRGRCARQGDPGESDFFISARGRSDAHFGSAERMIKMMERIGLEEGQELEHPWLNRSIETAQKAVEQHNFLIRKRTLEYDDVMNKQREVIYGFRNEVIDTDDPRGLIMEVIDEAIPEKVNGFLPPESRAQRRTTRRCSAGST